KARWTDSAGCLIVCNLAHDAPGGFPEGMPRVRRAARTRRERWRLTLLDTITCPKDLRKLSLDELQELAGEMRHRIVEAVSKNGGHLASNLGVVELTIALHYVYDFGKYPKGPDRLL